MLRRGSRREPDHKKVVSENVWPPFVGKKNPDRLLQTKIEVWGAISKEKKQS